MTDNFAGRLSASAVQATISRRSVKAAIACLLLLVLAACAGGPQFDQVQSGFPPLAPGMGRIYIYRTTVMGAAIQPSVKLDGETVGDAAPNGFFYVDRPAGTHQISTSTEVTRVLSLTLESGQVRYVRLGISFGFLVGHVYPELVDDSEGMKEIKDLHYTGK